MAEMADVCSTHQPYRNNGNNDDGTLHPLKTILNWLSFFFQILLQIIRDTPSWAQVLTYVGFRKHHLLLSSDTSDSSENGLSSPTVFKTLRAELEMVEEEDSTLVFGPACPALPPAYSNGVLEKMTVVLDLDETLVCAYETSSLPTIIRTQATEAGLKSFELECTSTEREADGRLKVNHVTVFERPGLHDFLEQLSEFADLVLFTAGLEGYASPLVDKIDVENRFCLRLYRPATTTTEQREHVKDLSCLSRSFSRTVLVDNNPFSFLLQPLNGIPCIPFYAGQPNDNQLMEAILPLLKHLSLEQDVRPILHERFRMPEWFEKQGLPMSDWIHDSSCSN
ncbi:hypothetical protein ZOSMA_114G00680 [Zostera marina]|uniref:FCP1 homology domain-containing protein n=1 Tax=Zostera marina TaxID=29655 RepID=A0A0K9Q2D7_ZOSMR|nr:hypothetical protein ZOSMA_114G00680 [Zostera marina]